MVFNQIDNFVITNETAYDLKEEIKRIKHILNKTLIIENILNCYFDVIIVDNKAIRAINKKYRYVDKETDVISFALEDNNKVVIPEIRLLGDIYISIDKAREQSIEYEHSLNREISFLAVHGLLHLLGYDHKNEVEEKIMFKKQEEILDGEKW